MKSTQDDVLFFRNSGGSIIIEKLPYTGVGFDDSVVAWFTGDGNLYVNQSIISESLGKLSSQGLSEAAAADVLAHQTVSKLAHEIHHGLIVRDIERITGARFLAGTVESEILCYWHEAAVLSESAGIWSEAFRYDGASTSGNQKLLAAWRSGPNAVADRVIKIYSYFPSVVRDSDEKFAKEELAEAKELEKAAPDLPKEEIDRRRVWVNTTREFLEKPSRINQMRKYFIDEIRRVEIESAP